MSQQVIRNGKTYIEYTPQELEELAYKREVERLVVHGSAGQHQRVCDVLTIHQIHSNKTKPHQGNA